MTMQDLLALVQDPSQWKGDLYALAVIVRERQRQDDATLAESLGVSEVAEAIRQE